MTRFIRSNNGLQNTEQQKISKYISTHVTEAFPVRKAGNFGNENCKNIVKVSKSVDSTTASSFAPSSL